MKQFFQGVTVFPVVFALMCCLCTPIAAQNPAGPSQSELEDLASAFGMSPDQCNATQKQIDQVVAVYQSNLSDEEKIATLTKLWTQSSDSLRQAASKDSETAAAADQYLAIMGDLMGLAQAQASSGGNDPNASAGAVNGLKKLKTLTQNYVQMMKVLCPKLTLPPIMNQ